MKKANNYFKKSWIFGIILLIWTLFWYFKKTYYSGPYFITMALIYTISFFILIIYIIATLIILIHKLIKKKK